MPFSLAAQVELERAAQRRGSYRGNDEDGLVEVKISGTYEVKRVEIDAEKLGLTQDQAARLQGAIKQAMHQATGKARRKAQARLEAALERRHEEAG